MPDGRVGEVISVVARRRRWTLEQKLALVEEVSRPGVSVAAVADRHGMSRSLLFEWRCQVRDGTMPGVTRADATPSLVPVRVVEGAPVPRAAIGTAPPRSRAVPPCKPAPMIEVVLANGRMLRAAETIRLAAEVEQLELRLDEVLADIAATRDVGDAEDTAADVKTPEQQAPRRGRKPLPGDLPRRDIEHLPAEGCACTACGGALRKVGEDVTEILEYRPGRFEVLRHVRPAFSCREAERCLSQLEAEAKAAR